ncbi:Ninja-family protein AFP3, partial [Mucuna pruriens]
MVEVEEIELELGLSIGGSFGKNTVEKPAQDSNGMRVDPHPHEKREIQALRRMEARKKRELKRERVEPEWERSFKREKMDCHNGINGAWTTSPFHVRQFAAVQYLPLHNGFSLPCWVGREKNAAGVDAVNGGDRKAKSNGSSRCSSSAVSDYQSSSREDGGSTDSHSHSVHSLAEPPQLNSSKEISMGTQPEESASASSNPIGPKQGTNTQERKHIVFETQPKQGHTAQDRKHIVFEAQPKPNLTSPEPMKLKPDPPPSNEAFPMPLSNENSSTSPSMETKVDMGKKPPKPLSHISSLPQMPYVSTKGNNGKTVNGFLYRYTKSEVSIVCVCHGSTFSPAEFVQHAGGTDISHPLRHITVIPSAFG